MTPNVRAGSCTASTGFCVRSYLFFIFSRPWSQGRITVVGETIRQDEPLAPLRLGFVPIPFSFLLLLRLFSSSSLSRSPSVGVRSSDQVLVFVRVFLFLLLKKAYLEEVDVFFSFFFQKKGQKSERDGNEPQSKGAREKEREKKSKKK